MGRDDAAERGGSMTNYEKTVTVAAKMYEHRKTMRQLLSPENYAKKTAAVKPYIEAVMKQDKLSVVQATLKILAELPESVKQDSFIVPLAISAMLDMQEAGEVKP